MDASNMMVMAKNKAQQQQQQQQQHFDCHTKTCACGDCDRRSKSKSSADFDFGFGRHVEDGSSAAVFPVFGAPQITACANSVSYGSGGKVDISQSQMDEDEALASNDCKWPDIESGNSSTISSSPLPIFLKFEEVQYSVKVSKHGEAWKSGSRKQESDKKILNGITGSVGPGQILALMGPSGSGKTTLLKILGGRLQAGQGIVTYNDVPYNPSLKRRIGFVSQDDILFPQLTVQETLMFAAMLKLPRTMSRQQKIMKAETVLRDLGLERCRNTRIGGTLVVGVSGGERKRTSIGYEILVDPSLLLLDEPTSGLDSSTATKLVQLMDSLAHTKGMSIMMTIHQPSSRMFHMFHKLLLISSSEGHPIFSGKASHAMPYFASLGFVPRLPMNPADFLLDLATGQVDDHIMLPCQLQHSSSHDHDHDHDLLHRDEVVKYLQRKYKSELEEQEKEAFQRYGRAADCVQMAMQVRKEWSSSCWQQMCVLTKRIMRQRNKDYLDHLKMLQAIAVALLLGLLWWHSTIDTETRLRDQVGLMFYICIFWTSTSLFGAVYVFPFEQAYLRKERRGNMYRLSVYYLCSTVCDMIAGVVHPIMFICILYFMAGFRTRADSFVLTLLATLLIVITAQGAGEFIGAAVLSIKRAGTAASLLLLLFLLTGGFYVQHIPVFIKWLKHVSFMYYGFRLLLKVQYSADELYECSSSSSSSSSGNVNGGSSSSSWCKPLQSSPSFATIDLSSSRAFETCTLMLMALAYRLFAYICLRSRIVPLP